MTKEEWGDQDSIRSDPVARPRPPALGLFAIGPLTPLSTSTFKAGSGVDMVVAKPGSAFITPTDLDSLSGADPMAQAVLRHGPADNPMLTLSALAHAPRELPTKTIERSSDNTTTARTWYRKEISRRAGLRGNPN